MLADPAAATAALHGTILEGHPVREGPGDTLIVEGVAPADVLKSWRAARSVLPVTGRRPVFTFPGATTCGPSADQLAALDRAATTVDPWEIYHRALDDAPVGADDLRCQLSDVGGVDLEALAAEEMTLPTTRGAVDYWAWRTILADPDLAIAGRRMAAGCIGRAQWLNPSEVELVLLPTAAQHLTPAWVGYFGAARPDGVEGLAAAFRQWEELWGAELVAGWGTMLQLVVARRPAHGPAAWKLAKQLWAVGGNLEVPPWQVALDVPRSDAWFLQDRP